MWTFVVVALQSGGGYYPDLVLVFEQVGIKHFCVGIFVEAFDVGILIGFAPLYLAHSIS